MKKMKIIVFLSVFFCFILLSNFAVASDSNFDREQDWKELESFSFTFGNKDYDDNDDKKPSPNPNIYPIIHVFILLSVLLFSMIYSVFLEKTNKNIIKTKKEIAEK